MIKKIKYIGGFMKKIVLLCLLATFLLAQNPKIYSALGDVIYNNVDKIAITLVGLGCLLNQQEGFSSFTTFAEIV